MHTLDQTISFVSCQVFFLGGGGKHVSSLLGGGGGARQKYRKDKKNLVTMPVDFFFSIFLAMKKSNSAIFKII